MTSGQWTGHSVPGTLGVPPRKQVLCPALNVTDLSNPMVNAGFNGNSRCWAWQNTCINKINIDVCFFLGCFFFGDWVLCSVKHIVCLASKVRSTNAPINNSDSGIRLLLECSRSQMIRRTMPTLTHGLLRFLTGGTGGRAQVNLASHFALVAYTKTPDVLTEQTDATSPQTGQSPAVFLSCNTLWNHDISGGRWRFGWGCGEICCRHHLELGKEIWTSPAACVVNKQAWIDTGIELQGLLERRALRERAKMCVLIIQKLYSEPKITPKTVLKMKKTGKQWRHWQSSNHGMEI